MSARYSRQVFHGPPRVSGSVGLQDKPVNCKHKGMREGRRGGVWSGQCEERADTGSLSGSSSAHLLPDTCEFRFVSGVREARGNLAFASTTNCARRRPTRTPPAESHLSGVLIPRNVNGFLRQAPPCPLMYTPCITVLPNLVRGALLAVPAARTFVFRRPREKRQFSWIRLYVLRSLLIKSPIIYFPRRTGESFVAGLF